MGLHPMLNGQLAGFAVEDPGTVVFKSFGPKNSRMTFGKFTCQLMADGKVEESRWAQPHVNHHLNHIYKFAPGATIFLFPGSHIRKAVWPGSHVGECQVHYSLYTPALPTPQTASLSTFKTLLDVSALEDIPCVPKMQKNFLHNPHAEMVYGRQEPTQIWDHMY